MKPDKLLATLAAALLLRTGPGIGPVRTPPAAWRDAPAVGRIGYETIELPSGEKMGLVGLTYLVEPFAGLCLGPAVYGAASGQRGGFFTIGAEAALCTRISRPAERGRRAVRGRRRRRGRAGGRRADAAPARRSAVGLRPLRAGVSRRACTFPTATSTADQLGFVLDVPMSFGYVTGGQRLADATARHARHAQRHGLRPLPCRRRRVPAAQQHAGRQRCAAAFEHRLRRRARRDHPLARPVRRAGGQRRGQRRRRRLCRDPGLAGHRVRARRQRHHASAAASPWAWAVAATCRPAAACSPRRRWT